MKLNTYNRAVISSALKRSNQRIVQLSKKFDPGFASRYSLDKTAEVESALVSHQLAPFQNSSYDKYLKTSKSGYTTFDIRKILKDIEKETLDPSEANDFLVKAAGVRFSPEGDATYTDEGGISTLGEVKKEAKDIVSTYDSDEDLLRKYEEIIDMRDNFQFDYKEYSDSVTNEQMENDPIISKLYNGGLNYDELKQVHDEIRRQIKKEANKAIMYGGN